MRGRGAHPKSGKRPEVLAVGGSGALQAASAGSAANKARITVGRLAVRAIAGSVAVEPPRGKRRSGPGRSESALLPAVQP
jgi:hypothetical protein